MEAVKSPQEQKMLLRNASWGTYERLIEEREQRPVPRIHVGNLMSWCPPSRFHFVRTELAYVPSHLRPEMVERLLREFLLPGGRLILCSYGNSRRPTPKAEPVGEILRSWGYEVAGEATGTDANGVILTRVAWVDARA